MSSTSFQSTHPVWGATTLNRASPPKSIYFNPRTPCGVRQADRRAFGEITDFNPRTPCGVRRAGSSAISAFKDFNPRTPCGVRPAVSFLSPVIITTYFNPRTPCGVRHWYLATVTVSPAISIHAPRVGCDNKHYLFGVHFFLISIHAPRVGCDSLVSKALQVPLISIHAPRVGCDVIVNNLDFKVCAHFNPRTPCGVRRCAVTTFDAVVRISIHAPRVGCDCTFQTLCDLSHYFNPRTPCGVRPTRFGSGQTGKKFQSTHPVWGATTSVPLVSLPSVISIHAPRVGCDFRSASLQ